VPEEVTRSEKGRVCQFSLRSFTLLSEVKMAQNNGDFTTKEC
jgi:hypothetical protein